MIDHVQSDISLWIVLLCNIKRTVPASLQVQSWPPLQWGWESTLTSLVESNSLDSSPLFPPPSCIKVCCYQSLSFHIMFAHIYRWRKWQWIEKGRTKSIRVASIEWKVLRIRIWESFWVYEFCCILICILLQYAVGKLSKKVSTSSSPSATLISSSVRGGTSIALASGVKFSGFISTIATLKLILLSKRYWMKM